MTIGLKDFSKRLKQNRVIIDYQNAQLTPWGNVLRGCVINIEYDLNPNTSAAKRIVSHPVSLLY